MVDRIYDPDRTLALFLFVVLFGGLPALLPFGLRSGLLSRLGLWCGLSLPLRSFLCLALDLLGSGLLSGLAFRRRLSLGFGLSLPLRRFLRLALGLLGCGLWLGLCFWLILPLRSFLNLALSGL